MLCRGDNRRGGGEDIADALRCDSGRCQELLVVEGDDLRTALGPEVALEIGRYVTAARASPDRIDRDAEARSPARCTILRLGEAM
jgi:hypothetical protein